MTKKIVHKATQNNLYIGYLALCKPNTGIHSDSVIVSTVWGRVTCKACLKKQKAKK